MPKATVAITIRFQNIATVERWSIALTMIPLSWKIVLNTPQNATPSLTFTATALMAPHVMALKTSAQPKGIRAICA